MRHADERLLTRALPVEAERAYSLLRDPQWLASVLAGARADVPELAHADRVAFPLSERPECAHLVVTMDGAPVTCLGPGMHFSGPSVPWPVVGFLLHSRAEHLRTRLAESRVANDEEYFGTLVDSVRRAWRMNRTEFDRLRMLAPLIVRQVMDAVNEQVMELARIQGHTLRTPPFANDKAAEAAFRRYSSACITLMAVKDEPVAMPSAIIASHVADMCLSSRGLWIAVNHPERLLEFVQRYAIDRKVPYYTAASPLVLVAHRFGWLRNDARRLLAQVLAGDSQELDRHERLLAALDQVAAQPRGLLAHAIMLMLRGVPQPVRRRLQEGGTQALADRLKPLPEDASMEACLAALEPEMAEHLRRLDVWRDHHRMPSTHPRPDGALVEEERARVELWRAAIDNALVPPETDMRQALLVTLAPVEALVPGPQRSTTTLAAGGRFMNFTLARVTARGHTPVRNAVPTPGRNAPCPCASGKKFKHCCAV